MNIQTLLLCILTRVSVKEAADDVYTNPLLIRELLIEENFIVEKLKEEHLTPIKDNSVINDYLGDYAQVEREMGHSMLEVDDFEVNDDRLLTHVAGNPIHVLRLFKRLTQKLHKVVEAVQSDELKTYIEDIKAEMGTGGKTPML